MGTRNLIAVQLDGEYRIAQYGQWDGYPSGQGKTVLDFLRAKTRIEKLRKALPRCRFLDAEGRDKAFMDSYNANAPEWSSQPDNRTAEQKRWFSTYITRDLGGKILEAVADSSDEEIILRNSIEFSADSLSCEYAYVIDLDANTLEVYKGFNTKELPAGHRFEKFTKELSDHKYGDGGESYTYKHVRKVVEYPLDSLPTVKQMEKDVDPPEADDEAA
jgi:hypothetical protein